MPNKRFCPISNFGNGILKRFARFPILEMVSAFLPYFHFWKWYPQAFSLFPFWKWYPPSFALFPLLKWYLSSLPYFTFEMVSSNVCFIFEMVS